MAEEMPQGQHSINGAIMAQDRHFLENNTAFSFVGCTIKGTEWILLGRVWQAYSRVIFAYMYMPTIVVTEWWENWGHANRNK
jgi:hypothetical protein